jgi:hypothetical protein
LTRQHLKVLVELAPKPLPLNLPPFPDPQNREATIRRLTWENRPRKSSNVNDDLFALQMLHAYGLVEEKITSSIERISLPSSFTSQGQIMDAVKRFSKSIENPKVSRSFRLSPLGNDFLKFMGLPKSGAGEEKASPPTPSSINPPRRTDS